MVKVGLLGAGGIAEVHADAYKALDNKAVVMGVADKRRDKALAIAKTLGAKAYDDAEALIEADIDVVDICLPTFIHEEYAIKAAEAGKHILCEKPIALTLESADNIIAASKKAGVKLMVGHCIRFWPEYVAVKERMEKDDLGAIKSVTASRVGSAPSWTWNNWMLSQDLSGGAVIDLHIHDVDFINWLMSSKARRIMAIGARSNRGAMDHINSLIIYENHAIASVEGDWLVPEGYPFTMTLRIVCQRGTIEFIFRAGTNIESRNAAQSEVFVYREDCKPEKIEPKEQTDAYVREIEYFLDCVNKDVDPVIVTPQEARESLKMVLAARQSVRDEKIIDLQ